jgi:hypothetical protein
MDNMRTMTSPAAQAAAAQRTPPTKGQQGQTEAVHDLPVQTRVATLVPSTFRAEDNSLEVVWTTGSRRRAYDWFTDQVYEEELAVTPAAVDMTRFEAGTVQVIDSHDTYSGVSAILGIATEGWIAGGEGRARIAFSTDPAKAGVVGDIKAGIIRAMSFGYSVQKYEITRAQDRTDGVNLPLYRAVRWIPMELTFCAVGADPNAGSRAAEAALTRSQPAHGVPCEFVRAHAQHPKETTMTEAELQAQREQEAATRAAAEASQRAAADAAVQAATAAAVQRSADITDLCARHGVPQLAAPMIREGKTLDQAKDAVLEQIARRDAAGGGHLNVRGIQTVGDEMQTRMDGIGEAIMHRVDSKSKLSDNGRQFRGMSLMEIGRDHLERAGVKTRGMTRMELATHVLQHRSGGSMGTSDFASLLSNVANKRLRNGYEENMPSYARWARRAPNAPDFKAMTVVNLAGTPDLLRTNEHGEFKYGAMTDGKETYSMVTYGRIVSFTRQALINDDLRGFDRLVTGFGNSAARLENRTVYAILTANAALGDGVALFHSTHANLAGSGTVIDVASLTAGRTAMRKQKGLQSEELNLSPAYLIVPAAIEGVAYQYTSANYVPATAANVNEFRAGGRTAIEPVVEALLDGTSATAWYLAANTGAVDTVEYCFLDGAEGPVIESEVGFEVDGISYKCREDFAAKAIDYRGLYKNAGA